MHTSKTHHRFIELRAQDWSLSRIAAELQVSKPTLIAWKTRFRQEIADLKSVELEALEERVLASYEQELTCLANHLKRVESILSRRNLEVISTEFLFSMAGALRSQIRKQRVNIDFSSSAPPAPDQGVQPAAVIPKP